MVGGYPMELRPLGRTGIRVSVLGLGTVKLGRSSGVKYPTPVIIPDDDAARDLLHAAAEVGINLIDTAPAYGTSEERLGRLLPGARDRWVICTKAGEEFDGGISRFDFTRGAIIASAERSVQRLNAGHLDILLLHSDGVVEHDLENSGALDALVTLKQRGIVRCFGVSTKTLEGALAAIAVCDVVMLTLNPEATADLPAIHAARERGVGVLVKKALASGRLGLGLDHAGDSDGALRALLGFAAGVVGVSSVIVGTTSAVNLRRNAAAIMAASDPTPSPETCDVPKGETPEGR